MLFDHRFWNSFSWTPHGLSMAYLWRIYGGSQGELFFWFFCLFFFGIWYTWNGVAPGLMRLFFCFGREGVGLKRAMCFWTKNGTNSELDRVVFIDGGKPPNSRGKIPETKGKNPKESVGNYF